MDDKHRSDELARLVDQWYSQARRVDGRSALMGGALGLLLSSRHGRGVLGKALKYGVVAGVGALAWQARSERERAALRSQDLVGTRSDDGAPPAGTPVAGTPVAGKPVAGKPVGSFATQQDDAEPPQVP
ncbi:DUF533 domain-containing protein [Halomonas sp. HP20-15]|uniref:DUF533 domain-containing protein n=1 Tax=Halomonas sp. HP20-15 TaxID=3085901 RepID=UPI0029814E3A|nr:DUF533 domain-containing protein [Halomonas sp. HP20-15]MDW5376652.1 DUF533 domain-containing protein [Halomonas sp. HP20-15]